MALDIDFKHLHYLTIFNLMPQIESIPKIWNNILYVLLDSGGCDFYSIIVDKYCYLLPSTVTDILRHTGRDLVNQVANDYCDFRLRNSQ